MEMRDMPGNCSASGFVLRTATIFSACDSKIVPKTIDHMGSTGTTNGKSHLNEIGFLFQELQFAHPAV
jgi:hypothetical protein